LVCVWSGVLGLIFAFGLWRTCRTVFLSTTQQQRRHDFMSQKILVIHLCILTLQTGMSPEQHWTYHALLRVLCRSDATTEPEHLSHFPRYCYFPRSHSCRTTSHKTGGIAGVCWSNGYEISRPVAWSACLSCKVAVISIEYLPASPAIMYVDNSRKGFCGA
jgi:hypothetical protein